MTVVVPEPNTIVGRGLFTMLSAAAARLAQELAGTVGGPVARVVVAPASAVPADGCCVDVDGSYGQCHARLARLYPSRRFPAPDAGWSPAPLEFAAEIELGVFRCVSGLDDQGEAPAVEEMAADTAVAMDDVAAMQATALAVFGRMVVLGQYTPLGPSGYCAGGSMLFTVAFNPNCPPGS